MAIWWLGRQSSPWQLVLQVGWQCGGSSGGNVEEAAEVLTTFGGGGGTSQKVAIEVVDQSRQVVVVLQVPLNGDSHLIEQEWG